jgi:anthranilate phosphoribosyltransferase
MKEIFNNLLDGKDLSLSEASLLVENIFKSNISNVQLSSILTLLHKKKESFNEIHAFTNYLKKKCKKINLEGEFMDTCGTGGDNKGSFNFSTATSILLSTFNIKISKHGNRSITSKSGSFDVLESLGINTSSELSHIKKTLKTNSICFLFAPNFHGSLKQVAEVRKSLPFKTIFNLLGPLLNPLKLKYQLLGVSNCENLLTHAKCLSKMNLKKAWVVFGEKGYDELTTTSKNYIIEVKKNKISKVKILDPKEIGFKIRKQSELKGGTPEENAFIMRRFFEGESGAIRDNVILNTAAGLFICDKVKNLKEGVSKATMNIDNGLGLKKLNSLITS